MIIFLAGLIFAGFSIYKGGSNKEKSNFYSSSIHATNRGIGFIYSKENGGLERLTGKTVVEMGCYKSKCHASTCDDCHGKTVEGKISYSSDTATLYYACKKCHGDLAKDNPDVHFSAGMKCMSCHTSREIHGDGIEHSSYMEPGFFDTKCINCHGKLSESLSHSLHKNIVDCIACHDAESTTCFNCHVDNRLKGIKPDVIPRKNLAFLLNHNGKVTLGNMLTYVYKNKTMVTFATTFGHSISKTGRKCDECHGTQITREMQTRKFRILWWKDDSLYNAKGVVPVIDDYDWNLVFMDQKNGKWIPVKKPPKPLLNYSGFCSPLTKTQFEKLTFPHAN